MFYCTRLIIRSKQRNFDTTGILRNLLRGYFLYFLPWTLYALDLKKRPLTDSSFHAVVNQQTDDGWNKL